MVPTTTITYDPQKLPIAYPPPCFRGGRADEIWSTLEDVFCKERAREFLVVDILFDARIKPYGRMGYLITHHHDTRWSHSLVEELAEMDILIEGLDLDTTYHRVPNTPEHITCLIVWEKPKFGIPVLPLV